MERKIGEIFEVEGVKLQVVKDYDGDCGMNSVGCYFLDDPEMCNCRQKCFASQRKDLTPVKFINRRLNYNNIIINYYGYKY